MIAYKVLKFLVTQPQTRSHYSHPIMSHYSMNVFPGIFSAIQIRYLNYQFMPRRLLASTSYGVENFDYRGTVE